jgi:hypothetical protein
MRWGMIISEFSEARHFQVQFVLVQRRGLKNNADSWQLIGFAFTAKHPLNSQRYLNFHDVQSTVNDHISLYHLSLELNLKLTLLKNIFD